MATLRNFVVIFSHYILFSPLRSWVRCFDLVYPFILFVTFYPSKLPPIKYILYLSNLPGQTIKITNETWCLWNITNFDLLRNSQENNCQSSVLLQMFYKRISSFILILLHNQLINLMNSPGNINLKIFTLHSNKNWILNKWSKVTRYSV